VIAELEHHRSAESSTADVSDFRQELPDWDAVPSIGELQEPDADAEDAEVVPQEGEPVVNQVANMTNSTDGVEDEEEVIVLPPKASCPTLSSKQEEALGQFAYGGGSENIPLCDGAIAGTPKEEMLEPFSLMRVEAISTRHHNQALARKFDVYDERWVKQKNENANLAFEIEELTDKTVIARQDLRQAELDHASLIVSLKSEYAQLATRQEAFEHLGIEQRSYLLKEQMKLEAEEAEVTGGSFMEKEMIEAMASSALSDIFGGDAPGAPGAPGAPDATDAPQPSAAAEGVARKLLQAHGQTLGETSSTHQDAPAVDEEVVDAAVADGKLKVVLDAASIAGFGPEKRIEHATAVCKQGEDDAAAAKTAAIAAIANEADLRVEAETRRQQSGEALALCATAEEELALNPDDVTQQAYKDTKCGDAVDFGVEADTLELKVKRAATEVKTTEQGDADAAAAAILVCERAAQIVTAAEMQLNGQRAKEAVETTAAELSAAKKEHTAAQEELSGVEFQKQELEDAMAGGHVGSAEGAAQMEDIEDEISEAQKLVSAANATQFAAQVAYDDATAAVEDQRAAALKKKEELLASLNIDGLQEQVLEAREASDAAVAEASRLQQEAVAAKTIKETIETEIEEAEAAVAKRPHAEATIQTQEAKLQEKKEVLAGVQQLADELAALGADGEQMAGQLRFAENEVADIEARISAARDTIVRADQAESDLEQLQTDLIAAVNRKIQLEESSEEAMETATRLQAEAAAVEAKMAEVEAFREELLKERKQPASGMDPSTAAGMRAAAEAAALEAELAAARAAKEEAASKVAADRAAAAEAQLAKIRENERLAKERAERKRREAEANSKLNDPAEMNIIILQEKFKAMVKEYTALREMFFTYRARDEDIVQKVYDAEVLYHQLTYKFWSLSHLYDELTIKLAAEVKKNSAMQPAHGSKVCLSCPVDLADEPEEPAPEEPAGNATNVTNATNALNAVLDAWR